MYEYEYDEYFKLWVWVEVPWYCNKYDCVWVSETMNMILFFEYSLLISGRVCALVLDFIAEIKFVKYQELVAVV